MTVRETPAETAFRVVERLRGRPDLWDVYGERIRRFEAHLSGSQVEMVRGPIQLEGFGYREVRPSDAGVHVGFAGSTDLSDRGIDRAIAEASTAGGFSQFPARDVTLPERTQGARSELSRDAELWDHPEGAIERFVHAILGPLSGRKDTLPSFGSVRVALIEATFANSAGAEASFTKTLAELEFAVRSTAGPEGPAPGEYWVNRQSSGLDPRPIGGEVLDWCRKARDARLASPMPSGIRTVLLPTEVLTDLLPATLGFRLSGQAALRGMMPPRGFPVAGSAIDLWDDGLFPGGIASAPWDDEGTPQSRRHLIRAGEFREPLFDVLHGRALGAPSSGSGQRDTSVLAPWFHFMTPPHPEPSTMVLGAGGGGSAEELIEAVGDGLWVDQLGYAFPDPVSTAFGGEVRLGYLIRKGRLAAPVRGGTVGGMTLAGPGEPSLLRSVRALGSHPKLVGRLCAPPLVVDDLTVAGA